MSIIGSVRKYLSFLRSEIIWHDESIYGLREKTSMLGKPLETSTLKYLFLHKNARIQPGLRLISNGGRFIVRPYAAIGAGVTVITNSHIPTVGIPQFFLGNHHINDAESDIIVEEGAWVGANCTLLRGAKIGRGAVVGACSMVNKEVPPYAVVVGTPAKIIACVFTKEQIIEHEMEVFPEDERLPISLIDSLFEELYNNLRVIGTAKLSGRDLKKKEEILSFIRK